MKLKIAHLYPELLNLYGDRGNIASLVYRTQKRGIECDVAEYGIQDTPDFENSDIIFIGGGSDKDQLTVCRELCKYKSQFKAYVENGGVVLLVCGGFELMGKSYKPYGGEEISALGILNIKTIYNKERHIGNVIVKSDLLNSNIVGFENHSGVISQNGYRALGKVTAGFGSSGEGSEGIIYKNLIATYLHGPLLPKNPALCDYILTKALEKKYGAVSLEALDDRVEMAANNYIIERFGK